MKPAICTAQALGAACVRKAPALVRCWCRELSVLDCEADGERWVFHVPARPANDVDVGRSHNAVRLVNTDAGFPGTAARIASHDGNSDCENLGQRQARAAVALWSVSSPESAAASGCAPLPNRRNRGQREIAGKRLRAAPERPETGRTGSNASGARAYDRQKHSNGALPAVNKPHRVITADRRRKASLADWLREEGSVQNTELAENGSQRGEYAGKAAP